VYNDISSKGVRMRFKRYSKGTIEKNKGFKWQGWLETKSGKTIAFVDNSGLIEFI